MDRSSLSDQQLLDATAAGDADAYGELFLRHGDLVVGFLRRRLASAEAAAELTAETFAAALLSVHRERRQRLQRSPVAARDRAQQADRQLPQRPHRGRGPATIGLPRLAVDDEELERIDLLGDGGLPASQALERLSAEEREAIVERIVHEHDYEEIAGNAGEHQATVRKRVSRGLMRLREEMGVQP